jgi:hypothetical protein
MLFLGGSASESFQDGGIVRRLGQHLQSSIQDLSGTPAYAPQRSCLILNMRNHRAVLG